MEQLKKALDDYAGQQESGVSTHTLRIAAERWALWHIRETKGNRLVRGLLLAAELCRYADLDDEGVYAPAPEAGKE